MCRVNSAQFKFSELLMYYVFVLKLINAVNPREEKACGVGGELQVSCK